MEPTTLNEFFQTVYRPLRLRGRSAETVRLYANLFKQFEKHLGRPPMLTELTDLTIAGYLTARADAGRSPWTIERERNQLLALGRLAAARGYIRIAPEVPPGVLPQNVPHAWKLKELQALFHAAENTPGFIGKTPAGLWWGCFLHAMYETSERVGALIAAPRGGFRGQTLLCPPDSRKGGQRGRVYRISPRTEQRIAAVLRTHNEPVIWPWPYAKTYLWYCMGKIVKRAGLDPRHMKFHAMRRTAASHFAAAGGDASHFLGHSSPRITEKYYLDPRIADTGPQPCDVLPGVN